MISIVTSSFVLSSVNKVTAGTFESFESFVSVIANVPEPLELAITQFADQVRIISTSQLIKNISRVLQKLLKYYHDTAISATFVLPSARVLPVIFVLSFNVSESFIVVSGSPLQYCNELLDVFKLLLLCSIKLYIVITTPKPFSLSTCALFISLMQSVDGALFLNIISLFLSSVCVAAASAPSPVIVIVSFARMHYVSM